MLGYFFILATIAFFYKAGQMAEDEKIGGRKRRNWALTSAGLWAASIFYLGWGLFMGLALQAVLFVALTAKEALAGHRSQERMRSDVAEALKRRDRDLRQRQYPL